MIQFIKKFSITLCLLCLFNNGVVADNNLSISQCDFGYSLKGAIAMHGMPDIAKTNSELCQLYHAHQTSLEPILRISEKERFSGLNYLIPKGEVSYSVRPWIVDTLMYRSPFEAFSMYPNIAMIDDIDKDRSFVVFKIDKRAKFSDQTPITANDVLFSFQKLQQQGLYNYQIAYKDITVRVIDSFKIRFDFKQKNRELPLILGLMPIFSAKTLDKAFSTQDLTPPIMSSPYKVITAEAGKSVTLKKDMNYWGLQTPQGKARFHFDTVKFEFFQNDIACFESFKAGQSDFFYDDNLKRLHTSYNFPAMENGDYVRNTVSTQRPASMYAFTLNTRRPMLDDIYLRKAMFLAFNFNAVSNDYLYGEFKQIKSLFAGSELAYDKNGFALEDFPTDIRQRLVLAHKILKANGYYFKNGILKNNKHEPVQFHLLLNNPLDEKFAGALKSDLEKIGVALTVQTVDTSVYQHYLTDFNYDMLVYSWANSLSPGIEQKNYWHCDSKDKTGSRNYAGICNPDIDTAVDKLVIATTRKDLIQAAAKLDYELMKNYYFIPLYGQEYYNIIARKNIIPSVGGATYFAIKNVKK
jgi:peptide/nickel transport system substrate-binding protein